MERGAFILTEQKNNTEHVFRTSISSYSFSQPLDANSKAHISSSSDHWPLQIRENKRTTCSITAPLRVAHSTGLHLSRLEALRSVPMLAVSAISESKHLLVRRRHEIVASLPSSWFPGEIAPVSRSTCVSLPAAFFFIRSARHAEKVG